MICASCGIENRAGSRFCDNCGAPLAAGCPDCGAPNRPDARFCATCGQTLGQRSARRSSGQTPTTPASAERRLVTVLFTDLVGFTTLAEDRDPEAVRELLSKYFDTGDRDRHAPRRDGREVHRRRGHGGLGHADRPRGRRRAGRPRRARAGRCGRHAAPEPPGARGRADRRGGGDARRHEPGHGGRRPRQHRGPPAGRGRAGHRAGRRGHRRAARAGDRLRADRRPLAQGQDEPGSGVAGAARRRPARRPGTRRRARGAVRRPRRGAAPAQGACSTPSAASGERGSSRSPAPAASARAGWSGSSRSTSTACPRTSGGTAAARRRTARASRSGRSARWSAAARG